MHRLLKGALCTLFYLINRNNSLNAFIRRQFAALLQRYALIFNKQYTRGGIVRVQNEEAMASERNR